MRHVIPNLVETERMLPDAGGGGVGSARPAPESHCRSASHRNPPQPTQF